MTHPDDDFDSYTDVSLPRLLLDVVSDAIDHALKAADDAGLYDDLGKFPAARLRVAAELVDRLTAEGLHLGSTDVVFRSWAGHEVDRLARATAERDEDEL